MVSYVERTGDLVLRPPFLHAGVRFDCFWLRGNRERLRALVARQFVQPSKGAVQVEPLSDGVALVVAQIERISSLDPVHRELGGIAEIDVAFWVPVRVRIGSVETVRWVIPYLFVDNPYALVIGRELYGFSKTLGIFDLPGRNEDPRRYAVRTWGLDRVGTEGRIDVRPLLTLERTQEPPGASLRDVVQMGQMLPFLGSIRGGDGWSTVWGHVQNLIRDRSTPILFLRQLRDVQEPTRAAYQEILEANVRVVRTGVVSPLRGRYGLTVHSSVTHPIAEDLGLSENEIVAAFRAEFDCIAEAGKTLWRASADAQATSSPRVFFDQPILIRNDPTPRASSARRRIAILGGGAAALTAALALTRTPALRAKYKVTVYQEGFRLGGKGASGRHAERNQRIEEHGLHVWFGCYENAFRVLREVYEELYGSQDVDARFAQFFHPHDVVLLQESLAKDPRGWVPWPLEFPRNDLSPGKGGALATPNDWLRATIRWARTTVAMALEGNTTDDDNRSRRIARNAKLASSAVFFGMLDRAARLSSGDGAMISALRSARDELRERILPTMTGDDRRRLSITVDLAITCALGAVVDGIFTHGFEVIDRYDFIEWLAHHGALVETQQSAPVRSLYSLCFAFEEGDQRRPNFSASVALGTIARILFAYSGAFMWKMQGGMGDVVFAPIYEVLQRRGVCFEFFHRIEAVRCSADGSSVIALDVARQADLKCSEYEPLVDIVASAGAIRAWPHRPRFEQLVDGDALREADVDFEQLDAPVKARFTLEAGRDFDDVVFGIALGSIRQVCADIIAVHPRWRAMVDKMGTVATIASQVWFEPDLRAMGFRAVDPRHEPIMTAYTPPLDTWADMTHTARFESWPWDHVPGHVAYFCGAYDEHHGPNARDATAHLFAHDAVRIFPQLAMADGALDCRFLACFDPTNDTSQARFDSQYFRVNSRGSERYVQSLKGTERYRLAPGDSGLRNLFLAGDWTKTGLNVGCVEAAVVSGLQCARAMGVEGIDIYGESIRIRRSLPASSPANK